MIGPEAPLVAGLADELRARGRRAFGPGRDAARLEGSKAFAKDLMVRHGIPTARAATFTEMGPARRRSSMGWAAEPSSRPTGSPPARA